MSCLNIVRRRFAPRVCCLLKDINFRTHLRVNNDLTFVREYYSARNTDSTQYLWKTFGIAQKISFISKNIWRTFIMWLFTYLAYSARARKQTLNSDFLRENAVWFVQRGKKSFPNRSRGKQVTLRARAYWKLFVILETLITNKVSNNSTSAPHGTRHSTPINQKRRIFASFPSAAADLLLKL